MSSPIEKFADHLKDRLLSIESESVESARNQVEEDICQLISNQAGEALDQMLSSVREEFGGDMADRLQQDEDLWYDLEQQIRDRVVL